MTLAAERMLTKKNKKLDLAEAAKLATEKEYAKEKQAHEAAKREIQRLQAENDFFRTQLLQAVEVAGEAVNGRWYADTGRYCGEIKMPQLIQATGTILNLRVIEKNGVAHGIFLAPDSNGKFLGNRIEWDNSPDETGSKIWQRKDDTANDPAKERDAALLELANMNTILRTLPGILPGEVIEDQKGEVEHASRQRRTWEQDKSELNALRASQQLAKVELASALKELEQRNKNLDQAKAKEKAAFDLVEQVEDMKIKHSLFEKEIMDKATQVDLKSKALASFESALKDVFNANNSARQVFV